MTVQWNGARVLERVAHATQQAIDDATREAADVAKTGHWWHPRTGNLERQIVTEHAHRHGNTITGRFGATYSGIEGVRSGFYGLFLEYRTPWLRPAADLVFPTLAAKIRRHLG